MSDGLPWFKLYTDLPSHRKALHLGAMLGDPRAWSYVVELWCWIGRHSPSGDVRGTHAGAVVESAAGWRGEPGRLVAAFLASGWLELLEPDGFRARNWAEVNESHVRKWLADKAKPAGRTRGRKAAATSSPSTVPPESTTSPSGDSGGTSTSPPGVEFRSESGENGGALTSSPAPAEDRPRKGKGGKVKAPPPFELTSQEPDAKAPRAPSEGLQFHAWCQDERQARHGLFPEVLAGEDFAKVNAWFRRALELLGKQGRDLEDLKAAWRAFLADAWGASRTPAPFPFRAFTSDEVWTARLPRRPDLARRAEAAGPRTVAGPAGELWAAVLAELLEKGMRYAVETLRQVRPLELTAEELVLEAADGVGAEWLADTYREPLLEALAELERPGLRVTFTEPRKGAAA